MKRLVYITCLALIIGCTTRPKIEMTIHTCSPMPAPRASAAVAVIDSTAYLFGGRDQTGKALNDLWRYDARTDTWTPCGTTPLSPRINPAACSLDGKLYLGLGFCGRHSQDSSYLRDWWQYDPKTDTWTQLADYPNHYTDRAVCFTEADRLLVGYGFCWNYRRDMFCYHVAENRWDSIDVGASFHGFPTRSFGGTGCTCNGHHYYGTGYYGGSLDWWGELHADASGKTGRWSACTDVPGPGRTLAASAATKRYVYLFGGLHYGGVNTTQQSLQDIRRYDPEQDQWTWVGNMPEALMNHCSFAIGDRIYFGLGETIDEEIQDKLYYIEE